MSRSLLSRRRRGGSLQEPPADGVVLFRNHPQTGWFSSGTTRRRGGSLQEPPADGVVLFRNHPQTGWFSSGTTPARLIKRRRATPPNLGGELPFGGFATS